MTLWELEKELARGVLRSVYLLLGSEEFLRKSALQALRSTALKADAFALNYSEFSAKSDSVQDALAAAAQQGRGTGAAVARVRGGADGAVAADHGDAHRGARTQEA